MNLYYRIGSYQDIKNKCVERYNFISRYYFYRFFDLSNSYQDMKSKRELQSDCFISRYELEEDGCTSLY